MSIINQRIRERRIALGLTLLDVAEFLGVKEATAQRYESGAIKSIGHETVSALSEILKCSPSYLMGWDEEPARGISKSQRPDISYVSNDASFTIELHQKDNDYYSALMRRLSKYQSFLHDYLQLNEAGKEKLHEQLKLLSKIPEYQTEPEFTPVLDLLNAAHADTGASPEDKKHDEDIMNDDTKWGN